MERGCYIYYILQAIMKIIQKLYMKAIDVICRDISSTIPWAALSFLCWDMLRERMQFVAQSVGQAYSELLNLHEKLLLDQDLL